jgi:HEAT repeat protein
VYDALCALGARPGQALPLLKEQLRPVAAPDERRLARLLADLDDDAFAVRERTTADLEWLGELAVPALRRTLAGNPSPEVRRRAEAVLRMAEAPGLSSVRLRALRAVLLLEHLGTPEARGLLEKLAGGAPEAWLTREAKASLQRLAAPPAAP